MSAFISRIYSRRRSSTVSAAQPREDAWRVARRQLTALPAQQVTAELEDVNVQAPSSTAFVSLLRFCLFLLRCFFPSIVAEVVPLVSYI
mmetsp:Transcript_42341/g.95663  ORF Transcript_42341/g.95663 Transcript_42341/m.95663 type:complete len:89 (-) Transcript_42341:435-701(-)